MIDLKEIEKEIKMLENSNSTSYSVCQKLAILYTVKDHLMEKEETYMHKSTSPLKNEI